MDPLDQVPAGLDGLACAVCEGSVPAGSIQLLAHRDALAFLQVDCPACRSTTLAFVLGGEVAADGAPSRTDWAGNAPAPSAPVSSDDLLDMHVFLRDWRGDVGSLLARDLPGPGRR